MKNIIHIQSLDLENSKSCKKFIGIAEKRANI